MHTEAFNHHPGQLLMNTGVPTFGRPSMGSWLNYGLGSESKNLPGYVVLNAGRGTSGGTSNWSSGFLPTHLRGRAVPQPGRAGPEPDQPRRACRRRCRRKTIEALRDLNGVRHAAIGDPEINSRIAAYELAFRMQAAAPELIDLSKETQADARRVRPRPRRSRTIKAARGGGKGQFRAVRHQLPAGPPAGRARRAVRQPVPRLVGPPHEPRRRAGASTAGMADQPVAALLKDLKRRGLLDSTLVLWLSRVRPHAAGREPRRASRR